jgi:hypothetical protein
LTRGRGKQQDEEIEDEEVFHGLNIIQVLLHPLKYQL